MKTLATIFLGLAFLCFLFGWAPQMKYGYSFAGCCACIAVALYEFGPQLLQ